MTSSTESSDAVIQRHLDEVEAATSLERASKVQEIWRELCCVLHWQVLHQTTENKRLRRRIEELEASLKEVSEERDTTNRIAEELYDFFSQKAGRHADSRRKKHAIEGTQSAATYLDEGQLGTRPASSSLSASSRGRGLEK